MIFRTEHLNEMSMEIAEFPYKPQMYKQERFLILVGTCKFLFAIVSFPSTSTFTDVLFSTFVLKTGSSIETWTGITSLEKNNTVEWTWKKKISIKKKERFMVILQPNHLASNEMKCLNNNNNNNVFI